MILELTDITGKDRATAHVALPEGATLNDVFESDEKLKKAFERQDCRAIPRVISGYTAIEAAFVGNEDWQSREKRSI